MTYIENLTQEERILKLLKERGERGVYVYEMQNSRPNGLGIAQYNARIKGLRRKGHIIKNTEPGHFILIEASTVLPTYLKPSNRTTKPKIQAQPSYNNYVQPQEEELVRVVKGDKVFWEKASDLKPGQLQLI